MYSRAAPVWHVPCLSGGSVTTDDPSFGGTDAIPHGDTEEPTFASGDRAAMKYTPEEAEDLFVASVQYHLHERTVLSALVLGDALELLAVTPPWTPSRLGVRGCYD